MKKRQMGHSLREITQLIAIVMAWEWAFAGCGAMPFDNIVCLTSYFDNAEPKKGFGVVVREDGDSVEILTAGHVVQAENIGPKKGIEWAREIEVSSQRSLRTAKSETAFRTETAHVSYIYFDEQAEQLTSLAERDTSDLVLLLAPRPWGFKWQFSHSSNATWGDDFEYVASADQWRSRARLQGTIQDITDRASMFEAQTPGVKEGSSGSPLFSASAFYGIITDNDGFGSSGVLAGPIRRFRDRQDMMRYGQIRRPDLSSVHMLYLAFRASAGGDLLELKFSPSTLENRYALGLELGYYRSLAVGFVASAEYFPISEKFPESKIAIENSGQLYAVAVRFTLNTPSILARGTALPYLGPVIGIFKPRSVMSPEGATNVPEGSQINDPKLSFAAGLEAGENFVLYSDINIGLAGKLIYLFNGAHSVSSVAPYVADTKGSLFVFLTLSLNIPSLTDIGWDSIKDLQ